MLWYVKIRSILSLLKCVRISSKTYYVFVKGYAYICVFNSLRTYMLAGEKCDEQKEVGEEEDKYVWTFK